MMTDKDLIRRALLGDQEAQEECTEKGIVLPCPFCGNEYPAITNVQGYGIEIKCQHCNITFSRVSYSYGRAKELCKSVTLGAWNTRPAQPVGRCGICSRQKPRGGSLFCFVNGIVHSDDFCSYFSPRKE